MFGLEYQYSKEFWEEFEDDMIELEDKTVLNELNKTYNIKGFTMSDYKNKMDY